MLAGRSRSRGSCCPLRQEPEGSGMSEDGLVLVGQAEPVPVEDDVMGEHVTQAPVQQAVSGKVAEGVTGFSRCGEPGAEGVERRTRLLAREDASQVNSE